MEIRRALQSLIPLVGQNPAPAKPVQPLQALLPGQRLEARVLAQVNTRQLLLEMAGQRVVAESGTSLRTGTRVTLEVVKPGPQPQLRVLTTDQQVVHASLKRSLPRQIPVAEAMRGLADLVVPAAPGKSLPPPVREQVTKLVQSLPSLKDLTSADKLVQSLRQSGLFSEALSRANTSTDLKQQLLRLAAVIHQFRVLPRENDTRSSGQISRPVPAGTKEGHAKPTPAGMTAHAGQPAIPPGKAEISAKPPNAAFKTGKPASPPQDNVLQPAQSGEAEGEDLLEQLSQKVSGAVARITLDQLASLPKSENPSMTWHFELPFRHDGAIHDLRLTIQGEKTGAARDPEAQIWSVDMELDLTRLGQIHAKLVYLNGEISTYLWSDQPATRALFQRHLERLALRFHEAGLTPGHFQVIEESPPTATTGFDGPLIDERT